MASQAAQYVNPVVSRVKSDREIAEYRSMEADYRDRGWFLVKAECPVAVVVLASKKTQPPTIVPAVQFDYTNYDAKPPSVRFADPFYGGFLANKDLPIRLLRMLPESKVQVPGAAEGPQAEDLLAAYSPDALPFLCIAGVKEYQDHPGHTGDPWELHRAAGEGRLVRLLEVISKHGLEPVTGLGVTMAQQISFVRSEPPR